jgi:ATP adenylyltransferase
LTIHLFMFPKNNPYNHLTAKERDKISMPARMIEQQGFIKGRILDFGCGFGKDVEELKAKNYEIEGYDPHYFPNYPEGKFDTILCFYVLNVLLPEQQAQVMMQVSNLLKTSGKAYFSVRRDISQDGYRNHFKHQKPTYQCNVILPFKSIFKNENTEIYEYQHYSQLEQSETDCPFCGVSKEKELIAEMVSCYAILEENKALIIPKRHVSDYFDLTFREQTACNLMLNFVTKELKKRFLSNSFKVEIKIGEDEGQILTHTFISISAK